MFRKRDWGYKRLLNNQNQKLYLKEKNQLFYFITKINLN